MDRHYTEEELRLRRLKRRREKLRKQRRNRKLLLILLAAIVVVIIFFIAYLRGAFETRASENMLTVEKNGTIIYEEVQPSTDNAKEIKEFAQKQIEAYNQKEGSEDVKLDRFSTDDDHIYLRTSYKDAATYTDFTGYELYVGTVAGAKKAGYDTSDIAVTKVTKSSPKRILVIKEYTAVNVPGTITGYSGSGISITAPGTAEIKKSSTDAPASLVYLLYR
jgi:ABC-type lipoprotein release transport system permease subunit